MMNRRQWLMAMAAAAVFPFDAVAKNVSEEKINWTGFQSAMADVAEKYARATVGHGSVVKSGLYYMKQLDIHSADFIKAQVNAYESGNRFWLWQRLIKEKNINGGILNIDRQQLVPLHNHPGATGMVRILHGTAEVWLFDEVDNKHLDQNANPTGGQRVELLRRSRRVLQAGDMAVLTPDQGNIHALRSVSKACSMLDFFIPPYDRSQRSWYEPESDHWFDKEKVMCKKIPQAVYATT